MFRKFSLTATVDNIMPQTAPQNEHDVDTMDSDPLATYNNKVCAAWEVIKDTPNSNVFERNLFDRIAMVVSNDTVDLNSHEHLSAEEQAYLPVFERLVNVKKVKDKLALSRRPDQRAKYQQKAIAQIQPIHSSLQAAHKSYGMHYHLMASSWNPTTSNPTAGWCKEFSPDPVYLSSFSSPHHLLERFNRDLPGQKSKDTDIRANDQPRKDFTAALNELVAKHLLEVNTKKIWPRVHIHPKKGHCDVQLQSIAFPNDIPLVVHQTSDLKVTAEMLAAGPAAIMHDKEKMQVWHQDILARRYTVICVKDN
ncbi:hypothetical protein DFH28DRAFT_1084474 [Melampsora americana]|nr:hypothetical protein DFH28DRAFT_1084474 [Melampsora americana]